MTWRRLRGEAWLIPALLFLLYAFPVGVWPRFVGPNETSRVFLTMALYDRGDIRVDQEVSRYWAHNDLARYKGHYYSNKPPGTSLWLLLFTPLVDWITPGKLKLMDLMYAGRLLALSVPFVLFLHFLARALQRRAGPGFAWALVLAYALASNALVYATMYYSHNLAAVFHGGAYLLLLGERKRGSAFWAGLLTSFGVLCEVTTIAVPAVLAAYAWWSAEPASRGRSLVAMMLGALPPALIFFGYNQAAFENPLQLGYSFSGAHLRRYTSGEYGLSLPKLHKLPMLLTNPSRGLFFNAPWLLLILPAVLAAWRRRRERPGLDDLSAFACSLAVFMVILCGPFQSSGFATGPRYLVAGLAFLLFPIAGWFRSLEGRRLDWAVVALSAGIVLGAAQNALALMSFPIVPFLGHGMADNPFKVFTVYSLLNGRGAFTLATLAGMSVRVSTWIFTLLYLLPWVAYAMREEPSDLRRVRLAGLGLAIGLVGALLLSDAGSMTEHARKERAAMQGWMYEDSQKGRFQWQ